MEEFITNSDTETKQLAKQLAQKTKSGVITLTGDLGAGKTTFVQGFAGGLEIPDKIISPTFVLIRQYKIPGTNNTLYHVDLYRLENLDEIKQLGLEEIWSNPESIVLIEWPEKAVGLLPANRVDITIEKLGNDKRKITIAHSG